MQEIWNFFLRYAGLVALVCAAAAAYYLANAYRSRREGRSAMFDAERQVSNDRAVRTGLLGLVLVGLTLLFFGLALIGTASVPAAEPPTRMPTRAPTLRPGVTPTGVVSATRPMTTTGPTASAPLPATQTPAPTANTPAVDRKTAVVTGTGDVGGLKLRKTPNGEVIDTLPDGTVVELLGEKQTSVGLDWQKVRDSRGREGWVALQYLIVNP